MRGTIHFCLEKAICEKYGVEQWQQVLESLGYEKGFSFGRSILKDIDEQESVALFLKSAEQLQKPLTDIFDDFGEYWCCTYAPELYAGFYQNHSTTRDFILGLDNIHQIVTNKKPGAQPPRFQYKWLAENQLEVLYKSGRGMLDLFISLVKGLDTYFNSHTAIDKRSDSTVVLHF